MERIVYGNLPGRGLGAKCRRIASWIGGLLAARLAGRSQADVERALHIEEKLSMGPKKVLYLVRCRDREFLVAAGADTIVSMLEVAPSAPARVVKKAAVSRMPGREPVL
jgi:flagellar biogenesis protein FliO